MIESHFLEYFWREFKSVLQELRVGESFGVEIEKVGQGHYAVLMQQPQTRGGRRHALYASGENRPRKTERSRSGGTKGGSSDRAKVGGTSERDGDGDESRRSSRASLHGKGFMGPPGSMI